MNHSSEDSVDASDAFDAIADALRMPTDLFSSNTSAQTGSSLADKVPFAMKTSRTDLLVAIPSSLARSVCCFVVAPLSTLFGNLHSRLCS